jgi:hypothetical protein
MSTIRIQVKIPLEWSVELLKRAKDSGSTVSEEVRRILAKGIGTVGAEPRRADDVSLPENSVNNAGGQLPKPSGATASVNSAAMPTAPKTLYLTKEKVPAAKEILTAEPFKHRHCWEFPVPHAHKTCCDCNARRT